MGQQTHGDKYPARAVSRELARVRGALETNKKEISKTRRPHAADGGHVPRR
jgi:hypothetical protein